MLLTKQNVFLRKAYATYGPFAPCFAGGSESSWDKDKLQSPITTGSQHSIGHPTLSGQSSLGSAHPLSPLQQNHLLTNSKYPCPYGGKKKKKKVDRALFEGHACTSSHPSGSLGNGWLKYVVHKGPVLPLSTALVHHDQAAHWDTATLLNLPVAVLRTVSPSQQFHGLSWRGKKSYRCLKFWLYEWILFQVKMLTTELM